jgi:hypothetical protein
MELKIIDAGFFLCAFESDSERIPRSLQAVRQFSNSVMVKYTTKNMQKESN